MTGPRSKELYEEALKLFPGGVNSPVRAAVKPYPFYVSGAEGAYLYTVDGERLVDYVLGYGPLILGHKHPRVLKAVEEQLEKGWLYGCPAELEIKLAKKIREHFPSMEMMRFVNSGTEATMNAIRLARGYTGRPYIVKFDGCYHGAHDYALVKAGSAASHYGVATSAGILPEVAKYTLVVPFNDPDALEEALKKHEGQVAAVIIEPVMGNAGLILPREGFLKEVRRLCDEHDVLLIMDEVITGFRLALGGAQEYYGVKADITTLGKIVGGGFPIGVFGGRAEIMEKITPKGPVFNAGTFNAHPVTMAAGLATIEVLEEGEAYAIANAAARRLAEALDDLASRYGVDAQVYHIASMFQVYFTKEPVVDYASALKSDKQLYARYAEELLKRGVFIPPSQFESCFTSAAHRGEVVEETLRALEEAWKSLFSS